METGKILLEHSGEIICSIPFKLPSLNDYVKACRSNKYAGAAMKSKIERDIATCIQGLPCFDYPVTIHFHWVEGNKKRDLDNVAFAKKFILDALVKCGKLKDDNRRFVTGFTDSFSYSNESRVILTIRRAE